MLVFLLEVFLQELEGEFGSSGLMEPKKEQLQQCKFMLSVGGFRLVLSCGLNSKKCSCFEEVCQKSEIKHKELPPTQLWPIAMSSPAPNPPPPRGPDLRA